jgi:hypothetical protein
MNDNESVTGVKPVIWTTDHENILIDWADKAMCYRWLHAKANQKYKKLNAWFTVPVIIMSTITGTANFASEKVPENYRSYYSSAIGGVNIIAGIITTVQQFLKISELNEAHRVSSISWDKFYRKIRVELAKPPIERQNVYDFLKSCTEEYDRLLETSPSIDKYVIQKFQETFNGHKVDEKAREMYDKLKKPEICDVLESVKFSIYKVDEITEKKQKFRALIDDVVHEIDENEIPNKKMTLITEFYDNFKQEMMRAPTKQDLIDNLSGDVLNITEDLIDTFLHKKKQGLDSSIAHDVEMGFSSFKNMNDRIHTTLSEAEKDDLGFLDSSMNDSSSDLSENS